MLTPMISMSALQRKKEAIAQGRAEMQHTFAFCFIYSIHTLKSGLKKPHCCFDHVRCHVIHALLGKTGITLILLPLEPSFLPLSLLQQACPAASGVEPAHTGL